MNDPALSQPAPIPLWQRKPVWWLLALASVLPFCFVTVLPMGDLENHVGRYYILVNLGHSAFLQKFYSLHWSLLGNLGVDLLVRAIGPLLGVELATRIVVGCIPPLTVLGLYAVSKSSSGAVAPGALLALSAVYNWPFISGFVNFSLAAALALLVFALWVRLRSLSFTLRFLLFAPLAFLTFVAHTAGWGLLGLMVLAYELSRTRSSGFSFRSLVQACLQPVPFATIIVFIIFWRTGTSSGSGIMTEPNILTAKIVSMGSIWREAYLYWDVSFALGYIALAVCLFIYGGRHLITANLAIFIGISAAFCLCPHQIFGSAFADRRLLPYAAMFMPLAIGIAPAIAKERQGVRVMNLLAGTAILFFCSRIAVSCYAWHRSSDEAEQKLAILDSVPVHSRILGLVVEGCENYWARLGRPDHLQQYALVRRESMINGTFQNPGLNQVEAFYERPTGFNPNMGTVVKDGACPVPYIKETLQSALARLPPGLFDYVWIIREGPTREFDTHALREIASVGNDSLYEVLP